MDSGGRCGQTSAPESACSPARPPTSPLDRLGVPPPAGFVVSASPQIPSVSELGRTGRADLGGQSVVDGADGGKSSRERPVWGDDEGRTAHLEQRSRGAASCEKMVTLANLSYLCL